MNIDDLRNLCDNQCMIVTQHCIKRLTERDIELTEVKQAIREGEIIEDYPDDYPYPSCLLLGSGLHVAAGIGEDKLWIITVYRPDPAQWKKDLRTRRDNS